MILSAGTEENACAIVAEGKLRLGRFRIRDLATGRELNHHDV
jgi:hypothetical protein